MSIPIMHNADFNKNEIQNAKMHILATDPANPAEGQFYYNSADHQPEYHNGTTFVPFGKVYSGEQGVNINGTVVSLPKNFYDYLVEKTFQTPTISSFAITGLGGSAEVGTSVSVSGYSHQETNISNIDGKLTLKHGSTTIAENINPSDVSASGSFAARNVTRTTAGTETFTLSGTDGLGRAVTKSVNKTFYVPKIYGTNANNTVTAAQLLAMTHTQNYGNPQSVTLSANGYIYLASPSVITTVKNADTGFGVAMTDLGTQTLSINGVNVTYHVYRTDQLQAQTIKLTIS